MQMIDTVSLSRLPHSTDISRRRGFSLVQMSILVTIMGLYMAAVLPGGKSGSPVERQLTTEEKLNTIQKVLVSYKATYGKLPCPADGRLMPSNANYGIAAANDGTCVGGAPAAGLTGPANLVGGMIPVRTLGLHDSYALDGYGRKYTYLVDQRATDGTSCRALTSGSAVVQVQDAAAVVTPAMAAFISHGASGYGAYPATGAAEPLLRILPGATTAAALDAGKLQNASVLSTGVESFDATLVKKEKSGSYDDLVRLENTCCVENACSASVYDGPEVAVSVDDSSATKNNLTALQVSAGVFGTPNYLTTGATTGRYALFSPDNRYLLSSTCVGGCGVSVMPTLFKRSALTFSSIYDASTTNFPNLPSGFFDGAVWSKDAKYIFMKFSSPDSFRIYSNNGNDTFSRITPAAFASGTYLTLNESSGAKDANIMIINMTGVTSHAFRFNQYGVFTATPSPNAPTGNISASGTYIMSRGTTNAWAAGATYLRLYKKRSSSDNWDQVDQIYIKQRYPTMGSWSPNEKYFAIIGTGGTVPFDIVQILNDKLVYSDTADYQFSGTPTTVDWSADGKYLAFGATSASKAAHYYQKWNNLFYYQGTFDIGGGKNYTNGLAVDFRN